MRGDRVYGARRSGAVLHLAWALLLASLLFPGTQLFPQAPAAVASPSLEVGAVARVTGAAVASSSIDDLGGWTLAEIARPAAPRGIVIYLPGYGNTAGAFEVVQSPGGLPEGFLALGLAAVALAPPAPTLYFDSESVEALDRMLDRVCAQYGVPRNAIVIGGLSAGGTAAIQLAELVVSRLKPGDPAVNVPRAVFAVDAPLDFERIARSARLVFQRLPAQANLAETRMLQAEIERVLGGPPDQQLEACERLSPFMAFGKDGGRARFLRDVPVRLYTEPDVAWWMQYRGADFYSMNALDAAALVNQLRILGNPAADLVTTSGRGIRPDGRRHPHSWSIVEPDGFLAWLAGLPEPGSR